MLRLEELFLYQQNNPLIFTQYQFLLFFTITVGIVSVLNKYNIAARNAYLLIFSLFFYYKSGGFYFGLLLFSTIIDYACGNAIYNSKIKWEKKFFLVLSMISNLGLLAYFKYSSYFVSLINDAFGTHFRPWNFIASLQNQLTSSQHDLTSIFLPIGISFFTFQTMSYTIDIYRGTLKPTKNIFDFAFFVSFFPQLVAGPIVRASDFLPQIHRKFSLSRAQFGAALFLILAGFIKKAIISDYISMNFVDRVFKEPLLYSGFSNLMAVYGYSIQIYCDFSGYSDMAIGLAALLGFQLPINFNSPYKAKNITDFWRRWHISLSTWLRDYLYISMGGNRKGKLRTYFNLMMTMLLGGLWHGAATKFIIWGGLHGIALIFDRLWSKLIKVPLRFAKTYKAFSVLFTFHFVAFCWIYFRADSLKTVKLMLNSIFTNFQWNNLDVVFLGYWRPMALMLIGLLIHLFPSLWKIKLKTTFINLPDWIKVVLFAISIFGAYQIQSSDIQPFIYFQF